MAFRQKHLPTSLARNLDSAFEQLVLTYQDQLYAFVLLRIGNPPAAQEVALLSLERAYYASKNYPARQIQELKLEPWLYEITRNALYNFLRERHTRASRLPSTPLDLDENAFVCQAAAFALAQTHPEVVSALHPIISLPKQNKPISSRIQAALHSALTRIVTRRQRQADTEKKHRATSGTLPLAPRDTKGQQPASRRQYVLRLLAGGLAVLLVMAGLFFTKLPRIQHLHPSIAPAGTILFTYQGGQGVEGSPVWSSESKYMALLSSFGYSVQVWNPATGNLTQNPLVPVPYVGPDTAGGWSWSPDGSHLAVTSADASSGDAAVQVWDTISGRNTLTVHNHANGILYTAWSPDGQWIVLMDDEGELQIWNTVSGRQVFTYPGLTRGVSFLKWSPENRRVLTANDSQVQVWDAATGQTIRARPTGSSSARSSSNRCSPKNLLYWKNRWCRCLDFVEAPAPPVFPVFFLTHESSPITTQQGPL